MEFGRKSVDILTACHRDSRQAIKLKHYDHAQEAVRLAWAQISKDNYWKALYLKRLDRNHIIQTAESQVLIEVVYISRKTYCKAVR